MIFFENSSFKYKQDFKFGSNLIINDISKITSLKKDTIEKMLNLENLGTKLDEEYLDKKFLMENL